MLPLLYESVFAVSPEISVVAEEPEVPGVFTCPVCGDQFPTEEAKWNHVKTAHPWHWHFWYAPYGKPLLGGSILGTIGLIVVAASSPAKVEE